MIPKLLLALVAFICLNSTALIESTSIPSNAVACHTIEKCEEKYRTIKPNGNFYVSEYQTKGCFIKGEHGFFGTGGTAEEMEESDLPGGKSIVYVYDVYIRKYLLLNKLQYSPRAYMV